jgi:hypothetical protein
VNHRTTLNNDALIGRITRLVERLTHQLHEEEDKDKTPQHEQRRLAREIEEHVDEQRERIGRQAVRLGEQGARIGRVREGVVRVGLLLLVCERPVDQGREGEESREGGQGGRGGVPRGDGGHEQSRRRDDEQGPALLDLDYDELRQQTEEQACQVVGLRAELVDQVLRTRQQIRELAEVAERFSRTRRDMDRGGAWRAPGRSRDA